MADLDEDFEGNDEIEAKFDNQIEDDDVAHTVSNSNNRVQQHQDDEDDDEDDDLNESKPPKNVYKELNDSGDELDEQDQNLKKKFKKNFNNLFANKHMMKDEDCVVQEEAYYDDGDEQKMEPFNLKEERREGYFDQFLNYHDTKTKETDPFYKMMDEHKEEDDKNLFDFKYKLSSDVIKKHKMEYSNYENAKTDINLVNEWKSLLPLFTNNKQSIKEAITELSQRINKYKKHKNTKKRKLDDNNKNNNRAAKKRKINQNESIDIDNNNKKKKKKKKRAWEITSGDENNDNDDNDKREEEEEGISNREFEGCKIKFELFSEKATMLFANDDHDIYEQTRDSLIERIKLAENEQLFKKHQQKLIENINNNHDKKQKVDNNKDDKKKDSKKLEDLLADFSDEDDDVALDSNELIWEYYWKNNKNVKYGPFSCQQMFDWNDLYFKKQPIMFRNIHQKEWMYSDQTNLIEQLKMYHNNK